VTALLPVAIGTSYFFNAYLLPNYLLKKRYRRFTLYTIYTIIISLYLEAIIVFLSLIVFTNYQIEGWNVLAINLLHLGTLIYLIVLVNAFIQLFRLVEKERMALEQNSLLLAEQKGYVEELEEKIYQAEQKYIVIRADRKLHQVELASIKWIESVGDYVKFELEDGNLMSKMRISHLVEELPPYFLRIHRAFLVSQNKIDSFTREYLMVGETELPISRTYRKEVIKVLN